MVDLTHVRTGTTIVASVEDITANPWRNLADYPINATKIQALQDSILTTTESGTMGLWTGVHARRSGDGFQLAFGHHRVEAFRRLVAAGAIKDGVPLVVDDYTDADMIRRMEKENGEDYDGDFLHSSLNPWEAVITAADQGAITLEEPGADTRDDFRRATPGRGTSYTATTVARFLGKGWLDTKGQANERARTCHGAVELMNTPGVKLTRSEFAGMGVKAALLLVTKAKRARKDREAQIELDKAVRQEALDLAAAQGDTNKVTTLTVEIGELEAGREQSVNQNGNATIQHVVSALEDQTVAAVERDETPTREPKPDKVVKKTTFTDTERAKYLKMVDGLFLQTKDKNKPKGNWTDRDRMVNSKLETKEREKMILALTTLAARAVNFAKELKK